MGQTVPTWRPLAFEATSATGMAHEVFRAAGTGTLNRAIRVWATRVRNMAAASITTVIRFDPVAVLKALKGSPEAAVLVAAADFDRRGINPRS